MGRKKKEVAPTFGVDQNTVTTASQTGEVEWTGVQVKEPELAAENYSLRDFKGLIRGVNYAFKPNGFIDWERMINPEHIILNRENFLKKDNPIDINDLTDEELTELKRKSKGHDRLILLAGLKELAQLRGYESIYNKAECTQNGMVVTCHINWIGNFETNGKSVESSGLADANDTNTDGLASKYLTAIAENRAFSRAVRNFLMIHTVSDAETKFNPGEYDAKPEVLKSGPQFAIQKKLKDSKKSFSEFQQWVVTNDLAVGAEVWEKEGDIPSDQATSLLSKFSEFLK